MLWPRFIPPPAVGARPRRDAADSSLTSCGVSRSRIARQLRFDHRHHDVVPAFGGLHERDGRGGDQQDPQQSQLSPASRSPRRSPARRGQQLPVVGVDQVPVRSGRAAAAQTGCDETGQVPRGRPTASVCQSTTGDVGWSGIEQQVVQPEVAVQYVETGRVRAAATASSVATSLMAASSGTTGNRASPASCRRPMVKMSPSPWPSPRQACPSWRREQCAARLGPMRDREDGERPDREVRFL